MVNLELKRTVHESVIIKDEMYTLALRSQELTLIFTTSLKAMDTLT